MSSTPNNRDDVRVPEYTRKEMNVGTVSDRLKEQLNKNQFTLYKDWQLALLRWLFDRGRRLTRRKGYARNSMPHIKSAVERFSVWTYANSGFTTEFTEKHLDDYWYYQLGRDTKLDSKRRELLNVRLILKPSGKEWEIPESEEFYRDIAEEEADPGFRDWFRDYELKDIKAASTVLHTTPDRETLSEEEIQENGAYLAQRLEKPKNELTEEDWEAESWKVPSLVFVSCDIGLRPCEVNRAQVYWVDIDGKDKPYIRIPREEDSKLGKKNRSCRLSVGAARVLQLWLDERKTLPEYEGTDALWLTSEGNRYVSSTLRRTIMMPLQREAGINVDKRENGWYMIRRGLGTDIVNKGGDISLLMQQLRIDRYETAMRYVQNSDKASDDYFDVR